MSATQELLDKAREVCCIKSDAELARRFGLTPAAVSNYRQGIRHPEPETIDALAKAIGQPPLEWALRIQAAREEHVHPGRARVWLRWSKQAAGLAASVAIIYAVAQTAQAPSLSDGLAAFSRNPGTLYIMSTIVLGTIFAAWVLFDRNRHVQQLEV